MAGGLISSTPTAGQNVIVNAPAFLLNGNTTNNSASITNIPSTATLSVGMVVNGNGIPGNTTITAINSTTAITISNPATATATAVSLEFVSPYTDGTGNAVQYIRLGGNGGSNLDTIQLAYNGTPTGSTLPFIAGVSPTALAVQNQLNTIPDLTGNIDVLGNPGGPFQIIFSNSLQNTAVAPISVSTNGQVTAVAGSTPSSRLPTSEVQKLTFNPAIRSANGNFTFSVSFGNMESKSIAWTPSSLTLAANIQAGFGRFDDVRRGQRGGDSGLDQRRGDGQLLRLVPRHSGRCSFLPAHGHGQVGSSQRHDQRGQLPHRHHDLCGHRQRSADAQPLERHLADGHRRRLRAAQLQRRRCQLAAPLPAGRERPAVPGFAESGAGANRPGNDRRDQRPARFGRQRDGAGPRRRSVHGRVQRVLAGKNIPVVGTLVKGNETQRIQAVSNGNPNDPTAGTFTVSLGNMTSDPITYPASPGHDTAQDIEDKINAMINAVGGGFSGDNVDVVQRTAPRTGTVVAGNVVITDVGNAKIDTLGLVPGMTVSGPGIPANTLIVSVDSKSKITISHPPTAGGPSVPLTFGGTLQVPVQSFDYMVTFNSQLANINLPQLVVSNPTLAPSNLDGGSVTLQSSTIVEGNGNSVQTINPAGGPPGSGFYLSFNGVPQNADVNNLFTGPPLYYMPANNQLGPLDAQGNPTAATALPTAQQVQAALNAVTADNRAQGTVNEVQLLTLGGATGSFVVALDALFPPTLPFRSRLARAPTRRRCSPLCRTFRTSAWAMCR